jgi:putative tricarboxylic transport membrane protein
MEGLHGLLGGLAVALQPEVLMWALWGCLLGNLVGVLPGLGSAGTIAILLPLTLTMEPLHGIVMLAAIFYGSNYGGTITAVLLNIPGEASSAVTTIDGHAMAKQGRAGAALGIAAVGSFIGGMLATLALAMGAPFLARVGLLMGPAERFALMVFALTLVAGLLGRLLVKGMLMALLGMLIGTVGMDPTLGVPRFTFGQVELLDGIHFVAAVVGLFGVSELLLGAERRVPGLIAERVGRVWPSREDFGRSAGAIARGSLIGTLLGMVPGATGVIASFLSYSIEASVAKAPKRFGHGAVEGVAGPETANNAFANANFIPLLALGIPGTASMAILMGGMMIYGLTPGPFLFRDNPSIVWAVIASMVIGNVMLLILNIPFVSLWIQILRVRYALLAPMIAVLTMVGSFTIDHSTTALWTTVVFGVLGYALRKLDMPLAPLVLTMIIGPFIEANLRRALQISAGDPMILIASPISIGLLILAAGMVVAAVLRNGVRRG